MKTICLLFFLFGTLAVANAQSPVAEPDTLKAPKQTDPVPQTTPYDANYKAEKIKITTAEFPEAIKRSLTNGPEYEGWQRGTAYKSKDGKEFVLEMREADAVRTFRFDKTGKLIID